METKAPSPNQEPAKMAAKVKVPHKVLGEHVIDGMVLPGHTTQETIDKVGEFHFRPDDLLTVAYPKCGSTWMQQVAWLVLNDGDVAGANETPLFLRSRYLECVWIGGALCIDLLKDDPSPRTFKTHLPYSYLRKQLDGGEVKTIVSLRNVKDMLVSNYHFYRMNEALGNYSGTFDEFFEMFKEKQHVYGDYFDHVLSWWTQKDNPGVLFVHYEDMKKDLKKEVQRIATFVGKDLKDEVVDAIVEACTFKGMKTNPMTNCDDVPVFKKEISAFLRKGEVGDWKNYLSEEQNEYLDKVIAERLDPVGLKMTYEL